MKSGAAVAAAVVVLAGLAGVARANTIQVGYLLDQSSDYCSGGGGFDACTFNGSPSIAKETPTSDNNDNTLQDPFQASGFIGNTSSFPSIEFADFTFQWTTGSSGSWSYNPDDTTDPAIRYWMSKDGSHGIYFYWLVDSSTAACNAGIHDSNNVAACLNAAVSAFSGTWDVPGGGNLSHISYFDTGRPPGGQGTVPLPAGLPLLGSVLFGGALVRRWSFRAKPVA